MTQDTSPTPFILETRSAEETEQLGARLGALIPEGTLVALHGNLAAGKTCLVRGMANQFATDEVVSSPTFTLVNQYGRLLHVDLYRIENEYELIDLGYEDLFEPEGICLVEWAERAHKLLPEKRIDILLEHVDETTRKITIRDAGLLPETWRTTLAIPFL